MHTEWEEGGVGPVLLRTTRKTPSIDLRIVRIFQLDRLILLCESGAEPNPCRVPLTLHPSSDAGRERAESMSLEAGVLSRRSCHQYARRLAGLRGISNFHAPQ